MAVYSVHARGADLSDLADAAFLRQGFAWTAFWFGPFWLMRQRLWLALAVWTALFLALSIIVSLGLLSFETSVNLGVLFEVLLGFEANHLLEIKLEASGYHLIDIIAERGADAAEIAFFRRVEPASQGRATALLSSHRDVLGLFPEPQVRR